MRQSRRCSVGNSLASSLAFRIGFAVLFVMGLCRAANAQVLFQDQQVAVRDLPALMARSEDPSDILLTSLDTIFHDREICCGKDSALGDAALAADPKSLQDVAAKLGGRHLLSDGRPIEVTAVFWPADKVNSGTLIGTLTAQRALLMSWNSHLYVVNGAVYRWIWSGDETGGPVTVIRKILLLDTSHAQNRKLEFDRDTDDLSKVQGLLFLQTKPI